MHDLLDVISFYFRTLDDMVYFNFAWLGCDVTIFLKKWLIFLYTNMINTACIYVLATTLYVSIYNMYILYVNDDLCVFV